MTIQVDGKTTVRDMVGRYPRTRPVFEQYGIDYCCGGGKSLAEAAGEHDLKLPALVDALVKTLEADPSKLQADQRDWHSAPLGELVNHIITVHHRYLNTALPRLRSLVPTVLKAHGAQHGETLRQVQDLFNALDAELSSHLMKEEQVLFPYIVAIEAGISSGDPRPRLPLAQRAIRSGRWNTSMRTLDKRWQSSAKSPTTTPFPRTPARPSSRCSRSCSAWRPTCTNTSTWKTTSCFHGRSNWRATSDAFAVAAGRKIREGMPMRSKSTR